MGSELTSAVEDRASGGDITKGGREIVSSIREIMNSSWKYSQGKTRIVNGQQCQSTGAAWRADRHLGI